jgi:KipI family sensor histidine kinase inhibitor
MTSSDALIIKAAGERAIVVAFDERIDRATNAKIHDLSRAISQAQWAGIVGTVPSYRSLLVYYDPVELDYNEIERRIRKLGGTAARQARRARRWTIPVCYGGSCAADLRALAEVLESTTDDVIGLHCSVEYMVYMVGFSPGFCYLGELPKALHVPRKPVPVPNVPANGIQIGGEQTAISSMTMPSGWYVVGRTPLQMFATARPDPFLLESGDLVRFAPIAMPELERLTDAVAQSDFVPTWEWVA